MQNLVNITQSKETRKAPMTDSRDREMCGLADKELRSLLLKSGELQRHTENETKLRT